MLNANANALSITFAFAFAFALKSNSHSCSGVCVCRPNVFATIRSTDGGCSVDSGWLVVAARDTDGCNWEDKFVYPDVMYSTSNTESASIYWELGDLLAVFYRWHSE